MGIEFDDCDSKIWFKKFLSSYIPILWLVIARMIWELMQLFNNTLDDWDLKLSIFCNELSNCSTHWRSLNHVISFHYLLFDSVIWLKWLTVLFISRFDKKYISCYFVGSGWMLMIVWVIGCSILWQIWN